MGTPYWHLLRLHSFGALCRRLCPLVRAVCFLLATLHCRVCNPSLFLSPGESLTPSSPRCWHYVASRQSCLSALFPPSSSTSPCLPVYSLLLSSLLVAFSLSRCFLSLCSKFAISSFLPSRRTSSGWRCTLAQCTSTLPLPNRPLNTTAEE